MALLAAFPVELLVAPVELLVALPAASPAGSRWMLLSGNWVGGPLAAALGFRALFALAAVTVWCGAVYTYRVLGRPCPAEPTN